MLAGMEEYTRVILMCHESAYYLPPLATASVDSSRFLAGVALRAVTSAVWPLVRGISPAREHRTCTRYP